LFSRAALQAENLNILQDSETVLLGKNDMVIVQVSCMPGGKSMIVSAFSTDSAVAERARNNVRAHIMKDALFDTCP
jgi:hypothetical protein